MKKAKKTKKRIKKKVIPIQYQDNDTYEWIKWAMGGVITKLVAGQKDYNANEKEVMKRIESISVSRTGIQIHLAEDNGIVVSVPVMVGYPEWSYGDGE